MDATALIEQLQLTPADTLARRAKIFALQEALLANEDKLDLPPHHTFAPDEYARSLFLPLDTVIVGKIHKHAHINVISFGHVLVMTEGEGLQELRGPLIFTSSPGTKRAVLALEDTLWTTVHSLPYRGCTDLAQIEDHVIATSYVEYEQFRLESAIQKQLEVTP